LCPAERKILKLLYARTNLSSPCSAQVKMMQLVTKSKAPNTIKSYSEVINKWKLFCNLTGSVPSPAQAKNVAMFIADLAVKQEPLSTFLKLSAALVFYHEANGFTSPAAVTEPLVKLILVGAKRESSERKSGVKKADTVSPEVVHQMIDTVMWRHGVGITGANPNLGDWRTAVRLYTYYKTFCR
jgi:hypothetical protein